LLRKKLVSRKLGACEPPNVLLMAAGVLHSVLLMAAASPTQHEHAPYFRSLNNLKKIENYLN
jgi:hypothetical protein